MLSFFKKIIDRIVNQNNLYYPGCMSKRVYKNLMNNYKKILSLIGKDYIMLNNLVKCCGSPVISAGYKKDYEDLKFHNKDVFNDAGIKKVITNCPACFKTFLEQDINTEHIVQTIYNNLNKLNFKKKKGIVTFHDPCHLGRLSKGIYEEPRRILEKIGYTVVEMKNHHNNSLCCGGGAGLVNNAKEVSKKIAKLRIGQAETTEAEMLVTCCPLCFHQLKKNNSSKLVVKELSEVILDAL